MDKLLELLRLKSEYYEKEANKVRKSSLKKYDMYTAKRAECDDLICDISNNILNERIALFKKEQFK